MAYDPPATLYPGVPPASVFSIPWQNGSPIVIDQTSDIPYYWNPGTGVTPFAGGGGGAVTSVFGRVGAVIALSGDYTADLITGFIAGTNITLTPGAGTLTINASGGGGGLTSPQALARTCGA